jgi:hypothetical protein
MFEDESLKLIYAITGISLKPTNGAVRMNGNDNRALMKYRKEKKENLMKSQIIKKS